MDNAFSQPIDKEVRNPSLFIDTVHLMMQGRKDLSRQDLDDIRNTTGDQKVKAVAGVLQTHFDDIQNLSTDPINSLSSASYFNRAHDRIFAESDKPSDKITQKQLQIMELMLDDKAQRSELRGATYGRIAERSAETLLMTGLTALESLAAIVDPEPVTKALWLTGAIMAGNRALQDFDDIFDPASTKLQGEFRKRQKMIDSWKSFDK